MKKQLELLVEALNEELETCFENSEQAQLDEETLLEQYWEGKARGLGTALSALENLLEENNEQSSK